ncbi:MAG TPA: uracil phosphoribosyltransferase [Pirellulaceae bacterium]|nr:uracil phosphoribosyltransferase [Pirellulaceae bacterium]
MQHHLAGLRSISTTPADFRHAVQRLTTLLAYEATRDLAVINHTVQTPLAEMTGQRLGGSIGLVPILRAGLGMVEPLLNLLPEAEVWHLGMYRDEATAQPVEYYSKLPTNKPVDVALLLDPMLATGGSAIASLTSLRNWGVPRVKVLSLIASQPGVELLQAQFPEVQLYVCAIDPELNAHKFIVPGLGDAGDRTFNTLPR